MTLLHTKGNKHQVVDIKRHQPFVYVEFLLYLKEYGKVFANALLKKPDFFLPRILKIFEVYLGPNGKQMEEIQKQTALCCCENTSGTHLRIFHIF